MLTPIRHVTLVTILAAQVFPLAAIAADGGSLEGYVQRGADRRPLAGIQVKLETGATATTGSDGAYLFSNVAPGSHTLVYEDGTVRLVKQVTIAARETTHQDIGVGEPTALATITVLGQFTPASVARAAQQQAPNLVNIATSAEIRKLPDITTAEALRRIPGISLETDEGEGRYINIRGLDADLNSTTFGGLRLPPSSNASPFNGYRAVVYDAIPTGLVGAITVTKSNLPQQDAEALGGTVEITPKAAPRSGAPFVQGNIGTGRESLRGTNIADVSVTAGTRFGGTAPSGSDSVPYRERPFSLVVTAAYYEDKRSIDDVEAAFFDDGVNPHNALSTIDQRYYQLNRKRHGVGFDFGFQPDADNSYYIRGFDAGYKEQYERQYMVIQPDGNAIVTPTGFHDSLNGNNSFKIGVRDEQETINNKILAIGGKNVFGGGQTLDYRFGYTRGSYDKPYDYFSTFGYTPNNATIDYNLSGQGSTPIYSVTGANYLDPSNYTLSRLSNSTAHNQDHEYSFAANLDLPVRWGNVDDASFKLGASVRLRTKTQAAQPYSFLNAPGLLLTGASSGPNISYYDGQYQIGPRIFTGYLHTVAGPQSIEDSDRINSLLQSLKGTEDIYAPYAQYQMKIGKLGLIGGLRVENTRDTFDAFAQVLDANGNATYVPVSTSNSYTNYFPGVQARYEFTPDLILRGAWSSTIARPGFNQANASLNIDVGAGTVTRGNPDLKPITANSFDVSIEKYLANGGILSFGIFDKEIKNYIVASVTTQTFPNNGLFAGFTGPAKVFSYSNSPSAYARGVEVNYEQRFKDLPGVWSGLGLGFNWTYVKSRFEIRPGEFSRLPSSSENTGNVDVFYEKDGLNLRLGAYYVSADLFGIQGPGIDIYNDKRLSADFGSSYQFNKNLAVYFGVKNLLNTPHKFYEGTPDRSIQREFYGQTYQLGLRFDY